MNLKFRETNKNSFHFNVLVFETFCCNVKWKIFGSQRANLIYLSYHLSNYSAFFPSGFFSFRFFFFFFPYQNPHILRTGSRCARRRSLNWLFKPDRLTRSQPAHNGTVIESTTVSDNCDDSVAFYSRQIISHTRDNHPWWDAPSQHRETGNLNSNRV